MSRNGELSPGGGEGEPAEAPLDPEEISDIEREGEGLREDLDLDLDEDPDVAEDPGLDDEPGPVGEPDAPENDEV